MFVGKSNSFLYINIQNEATGNVHTKESQKNLEYITKVSMNLTQVHSELLRPCTYIKVL